MSEFFVLGPDQIVATDLADAIRSNDPQARVTAFRRDEEVLAALATRQPAAVILHREPDGFAGTALRQALAARLVAGVEVKAAPDVADGFRVAEKDGRAYYDFSAASVAENLAVFLNPVMAGIVTDALKQGS